MSYSAVETLVCVFGHFSFHKIYQVLHAMTEVMHLGGRHYKLQVGYKSLYIQLLIYYPAFWHSFQIISDYIQFS